MRSAIDLHNKPLLEADEVGNIIANWNLPAKFEIAASAIT